MNAETLLENFEVLAEAPGGIHHIRELVLNLAVGGKLVSQEETNEVHLRSEIEGSFQLPDSWRWELITSITSDLGQEVPKSEFQYIDVGSINSKAGRISEEISLLNPEDAPSRARKLVKKGTVLYSTVRPYLRNIAIVEKDFNPKAIASTAFAVLHPSDQILSSYLFVCVRSSYFTQFVESKQKGVAYPAISAGDLKMAMIPLPPIAEQKRIVAKVDELMALCDQLEQQQKHRDNLRTSTRKSAIDAISTATTPKELETAWKRINNNWDVIADTPESVGSLRELVLRLGTRIGFGVDLQKSPKQKLNEVSHVSWGNLSLTKTSYVENGQFLAVSAAGPDGRIGHAEHDKLTPVISAIGARCGTMFMPGENFTAIKNTMTVTPDEKKINNWYLFYALKGSQLPRRGTAQPFLSKTDIENFEVTVPSSLEDQRVIVAKVDELMALCDQLESELKSRSEVAEKFACSVVSAT
jgi:restriction endonuclease S subunit